MTPSRMRRFLAASSFEVCLLGVISPKRNESRSDWPGAHGENVSEDAADAGGRALKRLDETRMVVRFDLERRDEAVANVHDPGILARALHHELSARGQALEMNFARFVGAVLAPHHAENAQLGDVRFAAEDLPDARVFFPGQAVFRGDFRSVFHFRWCCGLRSRFSKCLDYVGAR